MLLPPGPCRCRCQGVSRGSPELSTGRLGPQAVCGCRGALGVLTVPVPTLTQGREALGCLFQGVVSARGVWERGGDVGGGAGPGRGCWRRVCAAAAAQGGGSGSPRLWALPVPPPVSAAAAELPCPGGSSSGALWAGLCLRCRVSSCTGTDGRTDGRRSPRHARETRVGCGAPGRRRGCRPCPALPPRHCRDSAAPAPAAAGEFWGFGQLVLGAPSVLGPTPGRLQFGSGLSAAAAPGCLCSGFRSSLWHLQCLCASVSLWFQQPLGASFPILFQVQLPGGSGSLVTPVCFCSGFGSSWSMPPARFRLHFVVGPPWFLLQC